MLINILSGFSADLSVACLGRTEIGFDLDLDCDEEDSLSSFIGYGVFSLATGIGYLSFFSFFCFKNTIVFFPFAFIPSWY